MKNKLRKIVVLNKQFLWNFRDKTVREKGNTFIALSTLSIFPIENKKSKITVTFQTLADKYTGNPLKTGENISEGKRINLNYPSIVSMIIEFIITNKLYSDENLKPINIEGLSILSKLGYEIEKLKPVER